MSIDATDCQIWEPHPFSKMWFSHKFHGAGLRYEVAVCIATGDIVWVTGPFKCGKWPDIKIFQHGLKRLLGVGEDVEADSGYRYDKRVQHPGMINSWAQLRSKNLVRARHETVNARLKQFSILTQVFRHDIDKHLYVFMACAVMTQLTFERGYRPFQVDY
jgi:hypothetical protein